MLLWGFMAALALHSPVSPDSAAPFAVGLGLAVLAAVLLVAAAAGLPLARPGRPLGFVRARARIRAYRIPRLSDPRAAGHPRPRAPSSLLAVI